MTLNSRTKVQAVVLNEFVLRFHRNENKVKAGTVLVSDDGEYFRFLDGLGLLIERDAIERLRQGGFVAVGMPSEGRARRHGRWAAEMMGTLGATAE